MANKTLPRAAPHITARSSAESDVSQRCGPRRSPRSVAVEEVQSKVGLPPVTAVKRAAGRDDATSHSVIDSSRVVLCGGCGCCHWLSPSGRQVSRRIAGGTSLAATGLCPPVTAKLQHKCQEQRSAVTERPGDRECQPPLTRETRGSDGEIRARIGHQIWERSTLPQVTGLVPNRAKIVGVFEFMPLTSAPDRIRTCAHGSGGRSCVRLLPGKTRHARLAGGRMGGGVPPMLTADKIICRCGRVSWQWSEAPELPTSRTTTERSANIDAHSHADVRMCLEGSGHAVRRQ